MPVKVESPAASSVSQPDTPVSMPALTPQPAHAEKPAVPKFDANFLPHYEMGAFHDFDPFAPVQPSNLFDANAQPGGVSGMNMNFGGDPLMSMFMAGSETYGHPWDNSLHNSYSVSQYGSGLVGKTGTSVIKEEAVVAPNQLQLNGFEYGGAEMKTAGAETGTGTPGLGADKWSEWIEAEEWEGGAAF